MPHADFDENHLIHQGEQRVDTLINVHTNTSITGKTPKKRINEL